MTTPAPSIVDWIRLTIGDDEVTLEPSPGIDLHLTVETVPCEGYLDPVTRGPDPQLRFSVDLIPSSGAAAVRCESQAREVAARLGLGGPMMRDFALEAALGGEGLPYNRVQAPRLRLIPGGPPTPDDVDLSVRVFTAKVESVDGHAYTMRLVD